MTLVIHHGLVEMLADIHQVWFGQYRGCTAPPQEWSRQAGLANHLQPNGDFTRPPTAQLPFVLRDHRHQQHHPGPFTGKIVQARSRSLGHLGI
jgi:hypothetical protein